MRVDVDAFDRGRRLHEREPAFGRRRDILFKVEPIERAHIELRLAVAAAVGAAIGDDAPRHRFVKNIEVEVAVLLARFEIGLVADHQNVDLARSEQHTYSIQSLMRSPYAVLCLNKKNVATTHEI